MEDKRRAAVTAFAGDAHVAVAGLVLEDGYADAAFEVVEVVFAGAQFPISFSSSQLGNPSCENQRSNACRKSFCCEMRLACAASLI